MGVRGTWGMKEHLRKRVTDVVKDKNMIRVAYTDSDNPKAMDWDKVFPRKDEPRGGKYQWDDKTKKWVPADEVVKEPEVRVPKVIIH